MGKEITKAKLNSGGLEVSYKEYNSEQDFTNDINLKCPQIVHKDLIEVFNKLKPHVACICELPEAENVKVDNLGTIHEDMEMIIISGYTVNGDDETAGAVIIAQKMLKGSKVLNLTTPFMQFSSEDYPFAGELELAIQGCEYEVKQYLDEGKFGVKQGSLDFEDSDSPTDADIVEAELIGTTVNDVVSQRKGRKPKKKKPEPAEVF